MSALLAILLACAPVELLFEDARSVRPPLKGQDTAPPAADTAVEASEALGWPASVDCAALPETAGAVTTVPNARGFHDVIFDDHGFILGSDNNVIIETDRDGGWQVFVPGLGVIEQMDWLHDGDMVVSVRDTERLVRISSDGAVTTIAGGTYAYEVLVGPDGMIYAADNARVFRVDPDTGEKEVLIAAGVVRGHPRVLAFSPNYTKLYIGTLIGGDVYRVEVDEDLRPVGEPELFAEDLGSTYHDGMGMDVCGNVYLTVYSNSTLYRIAPNGEVTVLYDPPLSQHGHGMKWGTGRDGWRADALYMPRPYINNIVVEVVIGATAMGWDGEVLNGPP